MSGNRLIDEKKIENVINEVHQDLIVKNDASSSINIDNNKLKNSIIEYIKNDKHLNKLCEEATGYPLNHKIYNVVQEDESANRGFFIRIALKAFSLFKTTVKIILLPITVPLDYLAPYDGSTINIEKAIMTKAQVYALKSYCRAINGQIDIYNFGSEQSKIQSNRLIDEKKIEDLIEEKIKLRKQACNLDLSEHIDKNKLKNDAIKHVKQDKGLSELCEKLTGYPLNHKIYNVVQEDESANRGFIKKIVYKAFSLLKTIVKIILMPITVPLDYLLAEDRSTDSTEGSIMTFVNCYIESRIKEKVVEIKNSANTELDQTKDQPVVSQEPNKSQPVSRAI